MNARPNIVAWAKWAVANRARFIYTEGATRMADEHRPVPSAGPITCDCSAFVAYCYCWANAPDPHGQNYDREGYTGTLLLHGQRLPGAWAAAPGDVVVYGPGTGWHTALIVESGPDPLTVSHGKPGDPSYVRVSQDGRQPQAFLRFSTTAIGGKTWGPGGPTSPVPHPVPSYTRILRLRYPPMRGLDVAAVRHRLYIKPDRTNRYTPDVKRAVAEFQRQHPPLVVDGQVGRMTWEALGL